MLILEGNATTFDYRSHLAGKRVDLIFADPPQVVGDNSKTDLKEVWDLFTQEWLLNTTRYLATPGYLIIHSLPKLQFEFFNIVRSLTALDLLDQVIWSYNFGLYTRRRWVPSHSTFLIFSQGDTNFHWKKIAFPSQRQLVGDTRGDERGRVPGSVWNYPRLPGNDNRRLGSKIPQLPIECILRLLSAYLSAGQRVLDPFMGTGTVAKACQYLNLDYLGTDILPHAIELTNLRLEKEYDNERYYGWKQSMRMPTVKSTLSRRR